MQADLQNKRAGPVSKAQHRCSQEALLSTERDGTSLLGLRQHRSAESLPNVVRRFVLEPRHYNCWSHYHIVPGSPPPLLVLSLAQYSQTTVFSKLVYLRILKL